MSKSFIKLTLANGRKPVVIRPEQIALAMALEDRGETGEPMRFTRIIPKDITIDRETNWLDVIETPEEIMKGV
jgi:hypothetical protein